MDKKPLNLKPSAPVVPGAPMAEALPPWQVLIVDDDPEVHAVTRLVLAKLVFKGRKLALLSAYSGQEARPVLEQNPGIALILLDVVMESDDAGLQLVRAIRDTLANRAVRIILRTGQPGQAPEEQVIVDYDINDYKAKSELTAQKLFTATVAALRSYETIMALEQQRRGLEKILHSSDSLFKIYGMREFASAVLEQLSHFLECEPNGILCMQTQQGARADARPCAGLAILAGTGDYASCMSCGLESDCSHQQVAGLVRESILAKRSLFVPGYSVLFLKSSMMEATVALLHGARQVSAGDRQLLELFASKIAVGMDNVLHYQKMITAEAAATTDFLTGLHNRRQMLTLGLTLLAGAKRTQSPLAVAMLDIDFFKKVNDTFGHDGGDEVLRQMAALLRERFRDTDVVSRFGGEEFCVVCPNVTGPQAFVLFDGFRQALAEKIIRIGAVEHHVTISIGVATRLADSLDDMITVADALLYQAKQGGRNRVVCESL